MAANNTTVAAMPIKDLRPGMNNLNLTFIVIEIGRPTTTKENQVSMLAIGHADYGDHGILIICAGGQDYQGC